MIENWKTLLLTFVVGSFVYLFSVATTEYRQIRKEIIKEAGSYGIQDRNMLRFTALVRSLTDRQRSRVESLRSLERNAPSEQDQIDGAIRAMKQAEMDSATDVASLSGFSTENYSVAHAQRLFLAVFDAENNLRNGAVIALKRNTLNGSPDIAALDAQLVQKAQMLFSALDEEKDELNALEDAATTSISEYDSQYNVLGIKIFLALLFVIGGSATLIVRFLRERERELSQERFNQRVSA